MINLSPDKPGYMKILIVEDEASLLEIMTATLKKEGYVVENATDHDSAMEFGVTSVLDVYENLKVALDVGYIALWLDKSEDVWGSSKINGRDDTTRDAWNANLMFLYSF